MKMRFVFLFFLLCSFLGLYGQNGGGAPIRVLTNESTTTTIFFPSDIAKTIDPAVNYKFEYQNDDPGIGLLKGRRGSTSNLTVITENGYIYSFALEYAEKVETFNFMLTTDMAVGRTAQREKGPTTEQENIETVKVNTESDEENVLATTAPIDEPSYNEKSSIDSKIQKATALEVEENLVDSNDSIKAFTQEPTASDSKIINGEGDLYDIDREEYYRIFCENNYLQKTIFKRTFRQSKRVVLKLNNILEDRNEIYFVLQVENNSKKEYNVNGLSFFHKTGVGELQKIMKPLYIFNLQETIDAESTNEVVFVFKRFTISGKEAVYVVLDELENNRMVMLPLDNKQVNAPTN